MYYLPLGFVSYIFYFCAFYHEPKKLCFLCLMFCRLALSEDTALSMAFSVARRAAVVPVLLVNGTHRTTTRLYLDSLILQHQLQHLSGSDPVLGTEKCLFPKIFTFRTMTLDFIALIVARRTRKSFFGSAHLLVHSTG
jgi:hypothetical protein